jgi:hypothetical protein
MQAKQLVAAGLPVVALFSALLAPLLSNAVRPDAPAPEVRVLAFSIASSVMYAGCSILFLMGLKNFTAKLKLAYGVFCAALILFALAELQVPIGTLMGKATNIWLTGGGVLIPVLLAVGGMYAGIKLFANLYKIKGPCSKPWLIAIVTIIAAVPGYLLPVGSASDAAQAAKGSNALLAMFVVLFSASAVLLWQVKKKTTETYAKAMLWFFLAMLSFVAVALTTMGAIIIFGTDHTIMKNGGSILTESFFALFLLKAAYEFNVLAATTTAGNTQAAKPASTHVRVIDIIMATAQKASDATAIDPLLDNVRIVTSRRGGQNRALSPEDQSLLEHTYQELEKYLTKEDPVRRYSKEELRQLIRKELHISGPAFFDSL